MDNHKTSIVSALEVLDSLKESIRNADKLDDYSVIKTSLNERENGGIDEIARLETKGSIIVNIHVKQKRKCKQCNF